MRIAAWVFIVCAVLGASAAFLPSVQLRVAGTALGRRTQLSLFQANTNRDFARRVVVAYQHGNRRRLGRALVETLSPRATGRLGGVLGDTRDAMDTLDEVSPDDAVLLGKVLRVAISTFFFVQLAMAAFVFAETMREGWRRGRLIAALVLSVLGTAFAIGAYLVTKEAVWEANDEVGRTWLDLAIGAFLLPIAELTGLGAAIALLILQIRGARTPATT